MLLKRTNLFTGVLVFISNSLAFQGDDYSRGKVLELVLL